jgi:hypothetical protein
VLSFESEPEPRVHRDVTPLPCVIDVEASGFGRGSYPIEVGFVLPDGTAVCTLVRPPAHWTQWDESAAKLHGLTRATLARYGRSPVEVASLLNRLLSGATVYCDGWAHDYPWIAALFDEADMVPSFRLCHVQELLAEADIARWDQACADARAALPAERHRASNDARVIQTAVARVKGWPLPDAA